ncbi:hypothetical protein [Streptomyces sp. NPDC008141]|uniref:hypothetical protein n=1 Tax=Streptomyces sp. NPDC008141 TaxID=3364815 RepID=UPI0036E6E4BF
MVNAPGLDRLDMTTYDGHIWSPPVEGVHRYATCGVGMASHAGKMRYVTRRDSGGRLHAGAVSPLGEPSERTSAAEAWSAATPDLVSYKGTLYAVYRGREGTTGLRMSRVPEDFADNPGDHEQWEPTWVIPNSVGQIGPVAATHDGFLHVVYRGMEDGGNCLMVVGYNGENWFNQKKLGGHFSRQRPRLPP